MKQSFLIPSKDKRENITNEIRSEFRKYKNETDNEVIYKQLKKASDKFGYICMITPKRVHAETQHISGKTQYMKVDGEWLDINQASTDDIEKKERAVWSNWGRGNLDPDSVKRHEYLVRRQNYLEGPMKGYKPIWEKNWMSE